MSRGGKFIFKNSQSKKMNKKSKRMWKIYQMEGERVKSLSAEHTAEKVTSTVVVKEGIHHTFANTQTLQQMDFNIMGINKMWPFSFSGVCFVI